MIDNNYQYHLDIQQTRKMVVMSRNLPKASVILGTLFGRIPLALL
ncbi:MAG: hypothetical protein K0R28_2644 [Paenibacillus sp.]|nr:hypothetical protein [Paenibacillus sp.]